MVPKNKKILFLLPNGQKSTNFKILNANGLFYWLTSMAQLVALPT
jgi:hypothetical protein